jgi:hypothetical protein
MTSKKASISQVKEVQFLRKIVDLVSSDLDLALILKEVVKIVN